MAEPELVMPPPGTLCVTWILDAVSSDGLPRGRRLLLPDGYYARLAGPDLSRVGLLPVADGAGDWRQFDYIDGSVQGARFEEWCQEQQLATGGKICVWETAQQWRLPCLQYFPPGLSLPRTTGAPVRQPAAGWSGSESDTLGTAEAEAAAAGQRRAAPPQRRGQPPSPQLWQQQQPAQRRVYRVPAAEQPGWRPQGRPQERQGQEEPLSDAAQQGGEEQRRQRRAHQPEPQPFWVPKAESAEEQPYSSEEPYLSDDSLSSQPLSEQQAGRAHWAGQPHWREPPARRHGPQEEGQPQQRKLQQLAQGRQRPAGQPQLPGGALEAEWQRSHPQQQRLRRARAPEQQEPAWDEQRYEEWQQPARQQRQPQPERLTPPESQALEQQPWWEGDEEGEGEEAAQHDQWGCWPQQGQPQQRGRRQPALQLQPSDSEQPLPRLAAVAGQLLQAEAGAEAGAAAAAAAAEGAQAAGGKRRGQEGGNGQRASKRPRLAPAQPAAQPGQQVKSISRRRAVELSVVRRLAEQEIVPRPDRPPKPAAGTICPMCNDPVAESSIFRWCSFLPYGNQYICQGCNWALHLRCLRESSCEPRSRSDWRGRQRRRRPRRQLAADQQEQPQQEQQQRQQRHQ